MERKEDKMGIYEEIGLQKEFNLINKELEREEYNPLENKEKYKKELMDGLIDCIKRDTKMSYNLLKIANEVVNFFINHGEEKPDDLVKIINDNTYLICKTFQEIQMQSIILNRKLDNYKDQFDKIDIINSVQKRYQDLVESVSKKVSILMQIYNLSEYKFSNRDIKDTLNNKIKKLEMTGELPFLTKHINRFVRNKISHFDCYFNYENNEFLDSDKKFVCSMEEFKEYNIEVAAIEYGFMIATNVIALLGIKEIEAAEEYFRLIEAYVIKKEELENTN